MQTAQFTKGQSVTGKGRYAGTRYRVETCHRDGSFTVRAMFPIDAEGRDQPGFLGFRYQVSADALQPLPSKRVCNVDGYHETPEAAAMVARLNNS